MLVQSRILEGERSEHARTLGHDSDVGSKENLYWFWQGEPKRKFEMTLSQTASEIVQKRNGVREKMGFETLYHSFNESSLHRFPADMVQPLVGLS